MGEATKKLPLAELRVRYAYPELVLTGRLNRLPMLQGDEVARFNRLHPDAQFRDSGDYQQLYDSGYLNIAPLWQLVQREPVGEGAARPIPRLKLKGIYGATEVQKWLDAVRAFVEWLAKDKGLAKRFATTLSIRDLP